MYIFKTDLECEALANYYEFEEPNYERFSEVVAMAVDSVQRRKYSKMIFCDVVRILMNNYNIPFNFEEIEYVQQEEINYEDFSKCVSKVMCENFDEEYPEDTDADFIFSTVDSLIDVYDIPRYEPPTADKYDGRPLQRHLRKQIRA